MATTLKMS